MVYDLEFLPSLLVCALIFGLLFAGFKYTSGGGKGGKKGGGDGSGNES